MSKIVKKKEKDGYCAKCGTCGYIGCCGVIDWLLTHIHGKTDCEQEASMILEIAEAIEEDCEDIDDLAIRLFPKGKLIRNGRTLRVS